MKILAIETATEACSAALLLEGELHERYRLAPREHNRLILPMVGELLAEAALRHSDLDALAFGRGPGSFTGVRVATGVIQGISLGTGLSVIPISTLAALALEALEGSSVEYAYPCIDARMNEVYWGVYTRCEAGGIPRLLGVESVVPPASIHFPQQGTGIGVGSGWRTYENELIHLAGPRLVSTLSDRFPRAGAIAKLAAAEWQMKGGNPSQGLALPVYLRDQVAVKPNALRGSGE